MDTTPLPPFTPHHIRLVGHRDLGIVPARYVGCWLEIDHPEHGGRYGPAAVFRAKEVEPELPRASSHVDWSKDGPWTMFTVEAKASRGALVWLKTTGMWHLCREGHVLYGENAYRAYSSRACSYKEHGAPKYRNLECADPIAQITTWAREDGYEVPPWPGEPAATVEPQPEPVPAPVGTWQVTYEVPQKLAIGDVGWEGKPAPKDRTVYDPGDVQAGDEHKHADGTYGEVLHVHDGWIVYRDRLPVRIRDARVIGVEPVDSDIPF